MDKTSSSDDHINKAREYFADLKSGEGSAYDILDLIKSNLKKGNSTYAALDETMVRSERDMKQEVGRLGITGLRSEIADDKEYLKGLGKPKFLEEKGIAKDRVAAYRELISSSIKRKENQIKEVQKEYGVREERSASHTDAVKNKKPSAAAAIG